MKMVIFRQRTGPKFAVNPLDVQLRVVWKDDESDGCADWNIEPEEEPEHELRLYLRGDGMENYTILHRSISFDDAVNAINEALNWYGPWSALPHEPQIQLKL